jgi:hypothetical protein
VSCTDKNFYTKQHSEAREISILNNIQKHQTSYHVGIEKLIWVPILLLAVAHRRKSYACAGDELGSDAGDGLSSGAGNEAALRLHWAAGQPRALFLPCRICVALRFPPPPPPPEPRRTGNWGDARSGEEQGGPGDSTRVLAEKEEEVRAQLAVPDLVVKRTCLSAGFVRFPSRRKPHQSFSLRQYRPKSLFY